MYKTPEEMSAKIDQYFIDGFRKRTITLKDGTPVEIPYITVSDLVLYLGFSDRQSFYEYEAKPEFTHTIKRARTFIEREYEECLKGQSPAGAIFALKNFGWRDKQEVDHTSGGERITEIKITAV